MLISCCKNEESSLTLVRLLTPFDKESDYFPFLHFNC